jgi:hypothetical protein
MRKLAILALLLLGPGLEHGAARAEEGHLAPAAAVTPAGAAFTPFAMGAPSVAAHLDPAFHSPSWLPGDLEVRKGAGLAMSHPVHLGKADLELGVAGPVLRKRNLGLAFEVRF